MRFFEELKTAANDVNLELSEKQYEQFIKDLFKNGMKK